jgi:formylglycine-generating enzyme required for sulfatase activity
MAGEAIFISYRRDDSKEDADALYEALAARIGESHLYKDVDNIPLGADFGAHIRGVLPRCQIALIVIGPKWVKAKDQHGRRRLEDPFDWVRVEVELALAAENLRVVPVLVNGASMPHPNDVPPSLHPLLGRNAAIVRRGPESQADTARLLNALTLVVTPEMVRIPAGEFVMGSPADEQGRMEHEGPQHRVIIKAFELGKCPVTFAEWDAAIAAGATLPRANYDRYGRDRRPVRGVSWVQAQDYIAWLNDKTSRGYRLPSEAEWEYACRAGTTTAYSTGASIRENQAVFGTMSPSLVGSYPPNAFGLHDMHGTVEEWCEDIWNANYNGAPSDGSAWISGSDAPSHVLRGGSWLSQPAALRSARRSSYNRDFCLGGFGFRVARSV